MGRWKELDDEKPECGAASDAPWAAITPSSKRRGSWFPYAYARMGCTEEEEEEEDGGFLAWPGIWPTTASIRCERGSHPLLCLLA